MKQTCFSYSPVFHPLDGALLEDGRVALAPLPELCARRVHDEDDVQVLAHALREEGDKVAAVALVGGFLPKGGQERLEFLGAVEAGNFSGREEAVDLEGREELVPLVQVYFRQLL